MCILYVYRYDIYAGCSPCRHSWPYPKIVLSTAWDGAAAAAGDANCDVDCDVSWGAYISHRHYQRRGRRGESSREISPATLEERIGTASTWREWDSKTKYTRFLDLPLELMLLPLRLRLLPLVPHVLLLLQLHTSFLGAARDWVCVTNCACRCCCCAGTDTG